MLNRRSQNHLHRGAGAEALVILLVFALTGFFGWKSYSAGTSQPSTVVEPNFGIGLLVNHPNVSGDLTVNCFLSKIWCIGSVRFPPSVDSGTRFALVFSSGVVVQDLKSCPNRGMAGYVQDGSELVTTAETSGVSGGGFLMECEIFGVIRGKRLVIYANQSGGLPINEGDPYYRNLIFFVHFQGAGSFMQDSSGLISGVGPTIGIDPTSDLYGASIRIRYFRFANRHQQWFPPARPHYEFDLAPNLNLNDNLRTTPNTVSGSPPLSFVSSNPYKALWNANDESGQRHLYFLVFLAGILLSIAGACVVSLIHSLVNMVKSRFGVSYWEDEEVVDSSKVRNRHLDAVEGKVEQK